MEVLKTRQHAEGERRVGDLLRQSINHADVALWASEVRYWRGFADGVGFAVTVVDRTVIADDTR